MVVIALAEPAVSEVDVVTRIAMALLLGGAVGMERELSSQPAGLRTHITVALGAALFGVVSVHGFDAYVQPRGDSNYQVDVTRVASQVVTAVGFLGAGAILKEGASIRGLTTAASLWATAAIGLAVGIGSFLLASVTTLALLLSLQGLRAPRRWVRRRLARARATVVIELEAGSDPMETVRALLHLPAVSMRGLSLRNTEEGTVIEAEVRGPVGGQVSELLAAVVDRPEVRSLDIE